MPTRMDKSGSSIEKIEVSSLSNLKPPQFNGKKGDTYLMWKIKSEADMVMSDDGTLQSLST